MQHNYYSQSEVKFTPEEYEDKIKEIEIIMLDQGIMENQQIVNWAKTFMASTLFQRG